MHSPEDLARSFHECYERLAPEFGYETRPGSAVPWCDVPKQNKDLMIAVAEEILAGTTPVDVTLLDACREVMHDDAVRSRYPDGLNAVDILKEIRTKYGLDAFPLISVIDIADTMQEMYA